MSSGRALLLAGLPKIIADLGIDEREGTVAMDADGGGDCQF